MKYPDLSVFTSISAPESPNGPRTGRKITGDLQGSAYAQFHKGGKNKMYEKVLVPLDGSALAECTLSHVKNLFKDGSLGEVTILNVVKVDLQWAAMRSDQFPKAIDLKAIREPLFIASRKYLGDLESLLSSEGIKVKAESLEGNRVAETITEYAREKGMDLIIIGTHGYTGLKKLLLGSVALGVLNESHIPVLLIRPESCQA
jgi:nucleotide-binding universal stress UspA family protein